MNPVSVGETSSGALNPLSGSWLYVVKYCEKQIMSLRERNDAMLSDDETAALRGGIKELKAIIDLPNTIDQANRRAKIGKDTARDLY